MKIEIGMAEATWLLKVLREKQTEKFRKRFKDDTKISVREIRNALNKYHEHHRNINPPLDEDDIIAHLIDKISDAEKKANEEIESALKERRR